MNHPIDDPYVPPRPDDTRQPYYLIDRFRKDCLGRLFCSSETANMLNDAAWMKSRGFLYVHECDKEWKILIDDFNRLTMARKTGHGKFHD